MRDLVLATKIAKELISKQSKFVSSISLFAMRLNAIESSMFDLVRLGPGSQAHANAHHSLLQNLVDLIAAEKTVKLRDMFAEAEAIKAAISNWKETAKNQFTSDIAERIVKSIDAFLDAFEEYRQDYAPANLVHVIFKAAEALRFLQDFFTQAALLKGSAGTDIEPLQDESQLELDIDGRISVKIVGEVFEALEQIYGELCLVLGVNASEHPLKVRRILSGSLLTQVLGDSRVIKLIDDTLRATGGFLYRNFTTEGKISEIPKRLEVVSALIDNAAKLNEAGIDSSETRANAEKAAVLVSEAAVKLLTIPVGRLKVNGETVAENRTFLLGESESQKLLTDDRVA